MLHKGVLPWCAWGGEDLADPHPLDTPGELLAVDRVAITEQEPWSRIVRERLDDLQGCPERGGVIGDVNVDEFPTVMPEGDEGAEQAVGERGDEKKSTATMSRA